MMTVLLVVLVIWLVGALAALAALLFLHDRQMQRTLALIDRSIEVIESRWPRDAYNAQVAPMPEIAASMRREADQNASLEARQRHEAIITRGVENLKENYGARGVPAPDDDTLREEAEELARQAGIV